MQQRCAGCGQSMQDSIFALDKEWHPNCFIAIVPNSCSFGKNKTLRLNVDYVKKISIFWTCGTR